MKSSSSHKYYCAYFVLFYLVVLIELCHLTAALTIPERAPQRISLITIPQRQAVVDFETRDKSVDQGDKPKTLGREVVGVKLTNDRNLIEDHGNSHEINDDDDDATRIISLDGAEVDSVGQDRLLYALLPPVSSSGGNDKLIDQPPPPSPQETTTERPRWRTTPIITLDNDSDEAIGAGRTVNNTTQTNSSTTSNYDGYTVDNSALVDEEEEKGISDEGLSRNCILGSSDVYLAWWINNDGSLRKDVASDYDESGISNFVDLSGSCRSEGTVFDKLLKRLYERRTGTTYIPIKFLSLARNNLARAPYSSLSLLSTSLEYLSLAGNNFHSNVIKVEDWATFPLLGQLKELDLRNCKITSIQEDAFTNMQSLQKMYLANNNLISLSGQIFTNVQNLVHLDVSYNAIEYSLTNFYTNPFERFTRGLVVEESAFAELTNLKFLDFSHTRLEPSSMKSFVYLPSKLEQLSLCYTGVIVIGLGMFQRTPNLKVLDLSGNSPLTGNMDHNTFDGLQSTLEILAFENSSVKHLDWLGNLNSLKMLKLNDNNINLLSDATFEQLPSLDILDLSNNHVGNWFSRVFAGNRNLRILDLRSNNINVITTEMMKDFVDLEYLGLANNNFICNCMLRDLLDQALRNSNPDNGQGFEQVPNIDDLLITEVLVNYLTHIGLEQVVGRDVPLGDSEIVYNPYMRLLKSYIKKGIRSYHKIRASQGTSLRLLNADAITPRNRWRSSANRTAEKRYVLVSKAKKLKVKRSLNDNDHEKLTLDYSQDSAEFNFQLLDFDEEQYTCFNATTNEEYFFSDLESCLMERVSEWYQLVQQLRPHQQSFVVVLCVIFVSMFIVCIAYYKWWYIRYFFILIKNATILSFLNKESSDNGSRKSFGEISGSDLYLYDVFVSYCDENRDWVINELLPNIEQRQEISICLHERDFLVGLSILENIIACMDRSKCLLLVVSQSFLLSQWCQFEMHLAQHRLLETCRERLVLILLEDIPKRKRPKTLGYLMKTKTYIKWPLAAESEKSRSLGEDRKIFWKRLRRALIDTDWESDANN